MENINKSKRIGVFYSIGEIATLLLELVAAYGLFYLTTTQLIDANAASTIISIGTICGAIAGILVGYMSDNSQAKGGRRRSYVIRFLIPTVIFFIAFFTPLNLTGSAQIIFYGVVGVLFYICYYLFLTPFDALGGEIVIDYNARTFVRTLCTVFIYVGVIIADTLSTYIRSGFMAIGMSDKMSWFVMVLILAVVSLIVALFAWKITDGAEPQAPEATGEKLNIVAEYMSLLKIKAVRILSAWTIVYYVVCIIFSTMTLYFGIYVLGLSENAAATLFTISVATTLLITPVVNIVSNKIGKKGCLNAAMLVYIIYVIYILIKEPSGMVDGVLYAVLAAVVNGTALTCSYAMLYDLNEVVAFRLGEEKPSELMGLYKCASALGIALGTMVIGRLLAYSGFNGAEAIQSETTVNWLIGCVTWAPVVVIVICIVLMMGYKINAKNHAALAEALAAKREGKEYTTDEFAEVLK